MSNNNIERLTQIGAARLLLLALEYIDLLGEALEYIEDSSTYSPQDTLELEEKIRQAIQN